MPQPRPQNSLFDEISAQIASFAKDLAWWQFSGSWLGAPKPPQNNHFDGISAQIAPFAASGPGGNFQLPGWVPQNPSQNSLFDGISAQIAPVAVDLALVAIFSFFRSTFSH